MNGRKYNSHQCTFLRLLLRRIKLIIEVPRQAAEFFFFFDSFLKDEISAVPQIGVRGQRSTFAGMEISDMTVHFVSGLLGLFR